MNKKKINLIIGLILAVGFIWELSYSITNTTFINSEDREPIQIVHNPWDTEVASSNVVALVLEEAGFDVSLVSVDNAIMFESVAAGESDATTAAWLPITHGTIIETYEDQLVNLGPNLEGARSGLVVPSYMDVDSIADLNNHADASIMGIEPGAGIMIQTELALEAYDNLSDWELEAPSTGAMLATLEGAINNEEEIVITGWTPHWKFQQYDLKFLEDPKNVYGEAEGIYTLARVGLEEDQPEAYRILDNFFWEVEDMEAVTLEMQNGVSEVQAAQNWIDQNRDKVDQWLEID